MSVVTLDFETAYDQQYSLRCMSTEEYVTDPRFQIIGVAAKVDDRPITYAVGSDVMKFVQDLQLHKQLLVCHNTAFDGLILQHHFGVVPKAYGDTMLLAQALLKPFIKSVSLKSVAEYLNVGVKGDEVLNTKGKWYNDFSPAELLRFMEYCANDVDLTYRVFRELAVRIPVTEHKIIDLTLRMYLQPRLMLDSTVLAEHLAGVKARKEQLLQQLPMGMSREDLMSNQKFALALQSYGVEIPMKLSPTTGKQTYALAKNDLGFKQLFEEYADNEYVQALLVARSGVKSTIEESRTEKLLSIANSVKRFRVPLKYYAAHTGRYGGTEGINPQNFPRSDKSRMRFGIVAPRGHVIVAADLSQIEARLTAWIAGQDDLLQQFRQGRDVYSEFATLVYKRPITKNDPVERFVGKTCILGLGYGMGVHKLETTLKLAGVKIPTSMVNRALSTYRETYSAIPAVWRYLDHVINTMVSGGKQYLRCLMFARQCCVMPNGMALVYNNLSSNGGSNWTYTYAGQTKTLWGGKLTENIVQALARNVVMEQMLAAYNELGLRPVLQVHDELVYVVPEEDVGTMKTDLAKIMSRAPAWATDLPVAVEVKSGKSYGECK